MLKTLPMALTVGIVCFAVGAANAQDFPILDKIAAKVVQKYQSSTCDWLAAEKARPKNPQREVVEERVIGLLRSDAQLRQAFLSKVAAPTADKLLECGMIP